MSSIRGYLAFLFTVSRFRFWIYTGGTYVVGYALGMDSIDAFFELPYYIYLVYFFFLANVFIYGINDLKDEETDALNPKKADKENLLDGSDHGTLVSALVLVTLISLLLLVTQTMEERLVFLAFLFLSYFYSAPPLRFKGVPVLDFSSNMLYIMPGVFGYLLAAGVLPPEVIVLAGFFHVAAMHLFSAIPDIEYDRAVGIRTSAVLFGHDASLMICAFFWSMLAILTLMLTSFHPLAFLVLIYPTVPAALLIDRRLDINRVYWYFPYINTTLGGLLFLSLVIVKSSLL